MSTVWGFDGKRVTYDAKLYLVGNRLYWRHTDEFCRELDRHDIEALREYLMERPPVAKKKIGNDV